VRLRFHRVIVATASLCGSFFALDQIEKTRATSTPPDWNRIDGQALHPQKGPPNIGTSVWRIGPNTVWQSATEAKQLYLRPKLSGPIGISIAATKNEGLWVWLSPDRPSSATLNGTALDCMGQLNPPTTVQPIEVTKQKDGVLVSWGDERMVCPGDVTQGTPALRTGSDSIDLISIGRNRHSDGVPLSPLWWMSGLMIGGFLGMITLDALLSLIGMARRQRKFPNEE